MGRKLQDVWLGDSRLKVNMARFGREFKKVQEVEREKKVVGDTFGGAPRGKEVVGVRLGGAVQGKEMVDAMLWPSYKGVHNSVRQQVPAAEYRKLDLLPSEDRLNHLEHCFVVVLAFKRGL